MDVSIQPERQLVRALPITDGAQADVEQPGGLGVASERIDEIRDGLHGRPRYFTTREPVKVHDTGIFRDGETGNNLKVDGGNQTPETSPVRVAERLSRIAAVLKVKPAEFVARVGKGPPSWTAWTGGKNNATPKPPGVVTAIQICEAFGVTLDYIFRGKYDGLEHQMALKLRRAAEPPALDRAS